MHFPEINTKQNPALKIIVVKQIVTKYLQAASVFKKELFTISMALKLKKIIFTKNNSRNQKYI